MGEGREAGKPGEKGGTSPDRRRRIRSYVLRAGRTTPGQQRALDELLPRYGVPEGGDPVDFAALFGRRAPVVLEIGFGNGEATWRMARDEPEKNFVGLEVHPPGVGHLLLAIAEHGIDNLRVACADAVPFLRDRVADGALDGVRIWFPDPWPKKRHHKRRIVQPPFVALLARKLRPGGVLHLATDWVPYAEHMLEVLTASDAFTNRSPAGDWCEKPAWRPVTKYQRRGERMGHEVRDLVFERTGRAP